MAFFHPEPLPTAAKASPKLTVLLMFMTLFKETKLAQYDFFPEWDPILKKETKNEASTNKTL